MRNPKRWTADERRAWRAKQDAVQRMLREHIDHITAELNAKKKPA
jgi:hypothetical protein